MPSAKTPNIIAGILARIQHRMQHMASFIVGLVAECRIRWVKNALISAAMRAFNIDLSEAANEDITAYPTFNAFFTRRLKPGARPIANAALTASADGVILAHGDICAGEYLQVKGCRMPLADVIADDVSITRDFEGGSFHTIYLSPRDYHRVHMPAAATLTHTRYVAGALHSVSPKNALTVPGLFARNERLICHFVQDLEQDGHSDTPRRLIVVMVGALLVNGIRTVWSENAHNSEQNGNRANKPCPGLWSPPAPMAFAQGAEIGHFCFGSTVMVFTNYKVAFTETVADNTPIRMGQAIGQMLNA